MSGINRAQVGRWIGSGSCALIALALMASGCGGKQSSPASGMAGKGDTLGDAFAVCDVAAGDRNCLTKGQRSFITDELIDRFGWGGPMFESTRSDARSAAKGGERTVEEGDIYRIKGDLLYYYNTYRGLLTYNISNPAAPQLVNRVRVFGYPVEMYVEDGAIYALLRDHVRINVENGVANYVRQNRSLLLSIPLVDGVPAINATHEMPIDGNLREGLSRKAGDVLYVVSEKNRHYWGGWGRNVDQEENKQKAFIYSIKLAAAGSSLVQKETIFDGGNGYTSTDYSSSSVRFSKLVVSATATAQRLMVAENWDISVSQWGEAGCEDRSYKNIDEARITIWDISDASGAIKMVKRFSGRGHVTDQFKQAYDSSNDNYYAVLSERSWQSQGCSFSTKTSNILKAWNVTSGRQIGDAVKFGKPNETVAGTTFDMQKGALYAITAERVDPLYAIQLPKDGSSSIAIKSQIGDLNGDVQVFRFADANKRFLIGVGRDDSIECEGFGESGGWNNQKVAVSLFDVGQLNNIKLMERACIKVPEPAQWVSSGAISGWNRDQAHKMIGVSTETGANIITIPVGYTVKKPIAGTTWHSYERHTAVGVMTWDVSAYPNAMLRNHAAVSHTGGQVLRNKIYVASGRKLMALSNTHMSITDIDNLDETRSLSTTEIAPYIASAHTFGNFIVEGVRNGQWGSGATTEYRVKQLGSDTVISTFSAPDVEQALKIGDNLFAVVRTYRSEVADDHVWEYNKEAAIFQFDGAGTFTQMSTVQLPNKHVAWYPYWCGTRPFWFERFEDPSGTLTTQNTMMILDASPWGGAEYKLTVINLTNPAAPTKAELGLPATRNYVGFDADPVVADAVVLGYKEAVQTFAPDANFSSSMYYAERITLSGGQLRVAGRLNLPGKFVKGAMINGEGVIISQDKLYKRIASPAQCPGCEAICGPSEDMPRELPRGCELPTTCGCALETGNDGNALQPINPWSQPRQTVYEAYDRLNVTKLAGFSAELVDSKVFAYNEAPKALILDDKHPSQRPMLIVASGQPYSWGWRRWPVTDNENAVLPMLGQSEGDSLRIFDLGDGKLDQVFGQLTGSTNYELMGIHSGQLYVNLMGDGVVVVNTNNPAYPMLHSFTRTLGWASHVAFHGTTAYLASGHYGLQQVDLSSPGQGFCWANCNN